MHCNCYFGTVYTHGFHRQEHPPSTSNLAEPCLESMTTPEVRFDHSQSNSPTANSFPSLSKSETVNIEIVEGQLLIRDQIREYMDRGIALEHWSYLDYFLGSYDGAILKQKSTLRGRKPSIRIPYRDNCDRPGRCRVLRSPGHETMPYFPGFWFPKQDTSNANGLFEAAMLALLQPWRSLRDLKEDRQSFQDAYQSFLSNTSDEIRGTIDNIQFYHDCSQSAFLHKESGEQLSEPVDEHITPSDSAEPDCDDNENNCTDVFEGIITEHDIECALDRPFSNRELLYADLAISIGKEYGVLKEDEYALALHAPAAVPNVEQRTHFDIWANCLANLPGNEIETIPDPAIVDEFAQPQDDVTFAEPENPSAFILPNEDESELKTCPALNQRQAIVHEIITSHLRNHLAGRCPPQRLMIVHGQGGTGKSAMLNAIAETFAQNGASSLLAKTAMSGVAASIVRGQTLHTWAALPVRTPQSNKWLTHPSKAVAIRRAHNIAPAVWLTIDEMSMLTTPLLAHLSEVTGIIRCGHDNIPPSIPFGNLNILLLGDLHQLPPVANSRKELYNDAPPDTLSQLGRSLFEQFNIVVKLDEQMRITDPIWDRILQRSRSGECTQDDITEINNLVLSNPHCHVPDFSIEPWSGCVLVTPRNAVQALWNELMVTGLCRRTGQVRYIVTASDVCDGHTLSRTQRLAVAHLKLEQTNRLPNKIVLAIGMKTMVLTNIAPDADLANGSRGVVSDIILNAKEELPSPLPDTVHLQHPPAAILFQPLNGHGHQIDGLPPNTIPIFPLQKTFRLGGRTGPTIHREQFSLCPAYAFTDFKSQGQTMEHVIVDLAKPPSGSLTGFNAYVALSRSRGRNTIRLLRDFDEKLFTSHPNIKLRAEDNRLAVLEQQTMDRYQAGEFV